MRRITALLALLALVLTMLPAATLASPSVASSWIVTLRGGADPNDAARSLVRTHGGEVQHVYIHALRGFAFRGPQTTADAMRRSPLVARVEADAEVWLDTTQTNATWGLDRIDQRALPLDGSYTYNATGKGVTAYVIDSGIRFSHNEFGGRAVLGTDLVGDGQNGDDCNGHGTHVAGTIGGITYGVAKGVKLVSVRVFGCSGGSSWSTIIAAIDWVIADHTSGPAVANMSLGGGGNTSVDDAVKNMIADGVSTAVAAGNGNFAGRQDDACKYSPARVPEAMTISATNSSDAKASWANYGDCVDWFAPGVSITSAWIDSDSATKTISGTSMATPHSAGVAALYLEGNASVSPAMVRDAIFAQTTKDIVTSSNTANNDLLYSGFIGGGGGGGGTPPVADFSGTPTSGEAPLTVNFTDLSTGSPTAWLWDFGDGASATVQNPSHEYTGGGTYTVSLTASNADWSDIETKVGYIVVSEPSGGGGDGTSFSVTLAGSATDQGSTWTAIVTVTATDSANEPVNGVTVSGDWSNGATGAESCTTGDPNIDGVITAGACEVYESPIRKRTGSVTFTADEVNHSTGKTLVTALPLSIIVLKP